MDGSNQSGDYIVEIYTYILSSEIGRGKDMDFVENQGQQYPDLGTRYETLADLYSKK